MPPAETVSCPFCNAFVPVPTDAAAGRRLTCPRCLEAFAFLPRGGVTAAAAKQTTHTSSSAISDAKPASSIPQTDSLPGKARMLLLALAVIAGVLVFVGAAYINSLVTNGIAVDFRLFASVAVPLLVLWTAVGGAAFLWLWFFRVRRSNGAASLFVLANMVLMAMLTLGGALATQGYRRHLDAGLPGRPKRSPVIEEIVPAGPVTIAPARLAAIGYLPPGIDLLAGVHVSELWDDPAQRKLLEGPLKVGGVELRLAALTAKIGLKPGELDHFVAGMRVEEFLSVTLVVRTLHPYDAEKVRKALKAETKLATASKKAIYQILFPLGGLPALLWCADDRTLLISLSRDLIEQAVVPGDERTDPLVGELRNVLKERVGGSGPLWIAGHAADWTKTVVGRASIPEAWQKELYTIRTFAIWAIPSGKEVTLNAAARCDNDVAVAALEKWLAGRRNDKFQPTLSVDGNWLSLQIHQSGDAFRGSMAP